MEIISNYNNPNFFSALLEDAKKETTEVKFAVAYASDDYLKRVISFCKEQKIHLSFFGRTKSKSDFTRNNDAPISYAGLNLLIQAKPEVVKKINIIDNLHVKIYWFLNYGAYIGSANFTEQAWDKNKECGLWFNAKTPNYSPAELELEGFFKKLEEEKTHNLITQLETKYKEAG